jgi:hypothetical protein
MCHLSLNETFTFHLWIVDTGGINVVKVRNVYSVTILANFII